MQILRPVIQPLVRAIFDRWHDLAPSGSIGAELVGDHPPRRTALLLQQAPQQALGGLGITPALDDLVKDISVLVDGPPQPVHRARDGDHDLVEVPDVMAARRFALAAAGLNRSKLQRPPTDRLVRDDDPALEQHLLDQPKAQWESEVQPERMSDDLRWEAMALVANGFGHANPSTRLVTMFG